MGAQEDLVQKKTPNGRKRTIQSEKVRNYLIGIGALTGLILGLFSMFRGEPMAEKTWATLRVQVNALTEAVNKLHAKVVFLQAHEEGRTAAAVHIKLDALQKKYDALTAEQGGQKSTNMAVLGQHPASTRPAACRKGFVRGSDGRCRYVHRAVAAKVQADEKRAAAARAALEAEKRQRLEAERRKRELMKRLHQAAKPAPKPLPKLPIKLDEAAK